MTTTMEMGPPRILTDEQLAYGQQHRPVLMRAYALVCARYAGGLLRQAREASGEEKIRLQRESDKYYAEWKRLGGV